MSEKLRLGAKTAIDIEKLRDGYRPAAKRGAILFFVLGDLSSVNTMYQYSLSAYLDVFQYSLRKSLPDSILSQRLDNMKDTLTYNVYNYGCTGQCLASFGVGVCARARARVRVCVCVRVRVRVCVCVRARARVCVKERERERERKRLRERERERESRCA